MSSRWCNILSVRISCTSSFRMACRPWVQQGRFLSTVSSDLPLATGENNSSQPKPQSINRETTWSPSQAQKEVIMRGPRFEQIDMSCQPSPAAAIEMIAKVPIKTVDSSIAVCDGGGGPLGHPKIYINLDDSKPHSCGYCGLRFQRHNSHH